MTRKYWTEDELNALRHGFEFHVGLPWGRAVECTADAGTVRGFHVSREQWSHVAAIVGTRTAEQCAKRLQTERRMEQERRAALSKADVSYVPGPTFEAPSPVTASHARIDTAGNVSYRYINGCDASPYLGQASGRIVLSFNGRGAA